MYCWNVNDIKLLIRKYRRKAKYAKNPDLQLEYEGTINNLLTLLEHYQNSRKGINNDRQGNFEVLENDFKDIIREDMYKYRLYYVYFPLIKEFRDSLDGVTIESDDNFPNIKVSETGIVTLTTDFYNQFKGIFSSTYNRLAASFKDRLYFKKSCEGELYGGNTFQVYNTDEIFIEVIKGNTIQDYISHIHESSHGITCKLNPNIMYDWGKYCLIEVDSLFFEMIGTDYVSKRKHVDSDCCNLKKITFKDHLYSAEIICSKIEMYNNLSKKDLRNINTVKNYYMDEIGYDEILTNDAMYSYIEEYMHYIISYLIAIELYFVYLQDQEKALKLLKKIILLKGLDNISYLNAVRKMGIEPTANVKEYYKLLFKEEDDIAYEKKLQRR